MEIIDGKQLLKTKNAWYRQMHCEMGVMGVKSCDFVRDTLQDIYVTQIHFDENVWRQLKEKACHVFQNRIFLLL